ncbi:unnamed protein product [Calicophoron daubneyi]|uniref:Neurexin n=1 Tax=Calicophoron daubneyi TaxID=300641 RepID=A0AAV2TAY9_CALDB
MAELHSNQFVGSSTATAKRYRSIIRVGDDKWHTVSIQRRDRQLNYTVDDSTQIFDIPKDGKFLSHKHIILGRAQVLYDEDSIEAFPNKHEFLAAKDTKFSVFIGHVMSFVFNGMDYLHVAKNLLSEPDYADWRTKLEMTASEGFYDTLMEFPLQFEVLDSYVDLDLSGNYEEFDVHFWIKANKNFGTILLFDGGPEDLFGLEIVNGKLHLVYLKQAESERLESKSTGSITDSEWHHLQVIRVSGASQSMVVRVDGEVTTTRLSNTRLSTKQHVYIGGLPLKSPKSQVYRNLLHSSSGFAGCVASISVNQSNPVTDDNNSDLTRGSDSRTREIGLFTGDPSSSTWHRAKVGCALKSNDGRAASGHCTPRICQFDGRCVQQLGATICDCSMTSFTGRFCSEVSAALQISADPISYITFDLNPVQNTTRDQLAFGVQVTKRGSKVLLFVKGHGESADYLEVSVVSAKTRHVILVRYNMGSGQQTLYEPDVDIADGRYHVVQFIRNGASGILRTDLEFERTNFPKVKSGTQFNGVHKIQLGMPTRTDEWKTGRRDQNSSEASSEQAFEGFITGINFNEVDLIHVLKGAVIPGIFLSEQKNIRIQNNYQPNINHLKLAKKKRQETTSHLVANDMQLQSSDGPRRPDDFRSEPLITARPDCPEPGELFDLTVCRPSDPNGIISPFIEFQKPSVLDEATKEQKQTKQDWNTHQNKLKQSLPNDSGSHIKSSPTEKLKTNKSPNPSKDSGDKTLKNSDNEILIATPSDYDELVNKQVHQSRWDDLRRTHQQARPAPEGPMKFVFNIGLIASVSVGGICLLLALVCIIYRCMRRDEGSYNVEESLAYTGEGSHAPTRMKRRSAPAEKIYLSTLTPASSGRPLLEPEKPKQALLVSFADNCAPATSNVPLTIKLIPSPSPIQEDIVQPSPIKELEKKGTTLVKIETVEERRKPKSPKTITDSQEWYV